MDFGAAVEAFFVSRAPRKDSEHTVAAYRRDLSGVVVEVARVLGVEVSGVECGMLSVSVMRAGFAGFSRSRAKSSIARAWSVWNAFFGFLVAEGVVEGNPMQGVVRPRLPRQGAKPLRGEDAAERLLREVAAGARGGRFPWPQRDLAVLAVLLLTGVRSAELLGLEVGDVAGPVGERRLWVRAGKGGVDRVVPVEWPLEVLLVEYLESRRVRCGEVGSRSALFVDHRGRALTRSQLQYLVRQCYRGAGVSDRVERGALVHALRHTFATRLGQSGASAVEVMELLGHRSLQATQGYLRATGRELRQAAGSNPVYGSLRRLVGSGDEGADAVDGVGLSDDEG
ncbi:integrase/recombinase XerD [Stackebrandtia albiflava]|uniref:Integrase/recombinase XerD n=1 Tax=Stackebrandtia albiflava TaxID=406432 RepID=A0A562VDB3_9ACTN|nr:tyrosine-type recombinase/integrase [Stackebrandtia albiflava]TWJ15876.1 integrase/recombinase XerD [Stackebrandtia albiflava]